MGPAARIRPKNLETPMAHYHTSIDTKPARARRALFHRALNGALFAAAFLFVVALVCGILP